MTLPRGTPFVRTLVVVALVLVGLVGLVAIRALRVGMSTRSGPSMPDAIRVGPQRVTTAVADLDGPAVVARMAVVYAESRTYQDEGVLWNEFSGTRGHASMTTFETSFERGGGFRFEYRHDKPKPLMRYFEKGDRTVIWGTVRRARRWASSGGSGETTLNMQLGGDVGVSGGTSKTIPRMLLPDVIEGRRLNQLVGPHVEAIESVEGRNCYRIVAGHQGFQVTMWIDAETFLLRRRQNTIELGEGTTCVSTTAYAPRVNIEIDPAVFAFEPPG